MQNHERILVKAVAGFGYRYTGVESGGLSEKQKQGGDQTAMWCLVSMLAAIVAVGLSTLPWHRLDKNAKAEGHQICEARNISGRRTRASQCSRQNPEDVHECRCCNEEQRLGGCVPYKKLCSRGLPLSQRAEIGWILCGPAGGGLLDL